MTDDRTWWRTQLEVLDEVAALPSPERRAWVLARERELSVDRTSMAWRAIARLAGIADAAPNTLDSTIEHDREALRAMLGEGD